MQSFTVLCAKFHKILCKKVTTVVLKMYFPKNYMLTRYLGHKNLEQFSRVVPKSICRPFSSVTNSKNAGVFAVLPNLTTLNS